MDPETCEECGFHGEEWSDGESMAALRRMPAQFWVAVEGIGSDDLQRRPLATDGPSRNTSTMCGRCCSECDSCSTLRGGAGN